MNLSEMLKSTTSDSVVGTIAEQVPQLRPETLQLPSLVNTLDIAKDDETSSVNHGILADAYKSDSVSTSGADAVIQPSGPSLAAEELSSGILKIYEPSLVGVRGQIKELIGKQNKIYVDLLAEKFKLDSVEMSNINQMMNEVGVYREKLIKIKKQMQSIYQRNKTLKKRAANIYACKQKELQRKLQKQQHEESLIAGRQQTTAPSTPDQILQLQ